MIVEEVAAEKLAIAARKSISNYCYTECKAFCCRKGHLLLTANEVKLIKNTKKEDLKIMPLAFRTNKKKYILDFGSYADGCPNLCKYKCSIHKNPARPKTCSDFPLFIWKDKTIMITNNCPAVADNKLYAYLAEFKRRGYKLVYLESN
ncbi:MAG: YkgJ family cysteine cluster protein [Candidatus Nanoarchaeia archaeon]